MLQHQQQYVQVTCKIVLVIEFVSPFQSVSIEFAMRQFILTFFTAIVIIELTFGMRAIRTFQKYEPNLVSIEENVVYRALTMIEDDILMDKFCECQSERDCALQERKIIELSR